MRPDHMIAKALTHAMQWAPEPVTLHSMNPIDSEWKPDIERSGPDLRMFVPGYGAVRLTRYIIWTDTDIDQAVNDFGLRVGPPMPTLRIHFAVPDLDVEMEMGSVRAEGRIIELSSGPFAIWRTYGRITRLDVRNA